METHRMQNTRQLRGSRENTRKIEQRRRKNGRKYNKYWEMLETSKNGDENSAQEPINEQKV